MQHEQKPLKEALAPILDVLQQLGGKFTFMDDEGRAFVLASKDALEDEQALRQAEGKQQQLVFPQADSIAKALRKHVDSSLGDDVIERINRDIALAASSEQLESQDEIEELIEETEGIEVETTPSYPLPPKPPRIHFEPIKGDLAPDLQ
ncbi:MAG: hypothetical protein A3C02_01470 [Candidatus Andersenbacteria bacterium RIFCSPHIGHO2_02_FULL_45_11]|uniref:Uncharacterized protein n=1 Tax=Candidatus Andersenbacteria bacterium RIFCSPHIGHO2_12_FULL_45_11 TaxID=1797281 RepID=A0A1G1X314_9BACT|nr:MAG: hypothetical protein A2805_01220 [Candidatus Andersenbacteria bacterium RIFCSPHIGHO2_01_FULL_46_36]OGY34395.1 MAG: hypothetical protein A3D99_02685 [Candidatus Andersenbacteria bacterium RIFCSPHIGHO2_12_FULL_45_11]OGY34972.1 MAG: hypothetical protein A3C02_01470 [Candidatus Andersenbacteria bacterium RIFCSPHIGHO2_02_FULL_45_11]